MSRYLSQRSYTHPLRGVMSLTLSFNMRNHHIRVTPSALGELATAMHHLQREGETHTHSQPWRKHLDDEHADLVREVRSWWPETHKIIPRGLELLWIAAYTGSLPVEQLEPFFARLGEHAAALSRETANLTWADDVTPQETAARAERLESLQRPDVLEGYVRLLQALWDALLPMWERDGLPLVRLECTRLQQRLDDGAHLLELLPPQHFVQFDEYAAIIRDALDKQRIIVVTPLYFARGGYLMDLELEGTPVFLGYGARLEGIHRALAERARDVALRLKAFSDPTRLTLLSTIGELDVTVGDLARLLDITQPSVSGHLKVLQAAGLVTVRKKGVRSLYRADPEAIEALLKEARELLL